PPLLGRAHPGRAPRVRRTARALADDEGVRRRPTGDGAPADRDRPLRDVERRQARGRARAAPVRDARGAPVAAAPARRGAGGDADRTRHRRATRADALEIALLAHLRLAD